MKKTLFTLIVWFCATNIHAQKDDILFQQIENAGQSIHSMECILHNSMTRPNKEQTQKTGSLKYLAGDKIAARFPNDEYLIVNGNRMKIKLGIFDGTFRTDRNPIIKPISRMLLYAIKGQCQSLAEENGYNITLTKNTTSHIVTLTSKKKKIIGIGYRQVVFEYSQDNLRLQNIRLIDYKGNNNLFYFENRIFDKTISMSDFNL